MPIYLFTLHYNRVLDILKYIQDNNKNTITNARFNIIRKGIASRENILLVVRNIN